ncbi:MAG TPA: hypothetical protein VKP66_22110 [Steroidobacteraceae bacterium]|nr:hypothetical protein [Steroidobacteraceae bacterium]
MKGLPALALVLCAAGVFLGVPIGLYALMTRARRRMMREIRLGARERGWQFHIRRWMGDPTSFRIEGQTPGGLGFVLKTAGAGETIRDWSVRLTLRVPSLAGEMDVAVFPREEKDRGALQIAASFPSALKDRVATWSGTAAGAIGFLGEAKEMPAGESTFDAAYRVLALAKRMGRAPVDSSLAQRMLKWPEDAVAVHSVLLWRDSFGLHFDARLLAPANWSSVAYAVALAEQLIGRLPAPEGATAPSGVVDRLLSHLQ